MDADRQLIKILNRERRELKAEVEYLKSMLWDLTHSDDCDHPQVFDTSPDQIPEPEERRGEPTGINGTEEMVAEIIGNLLDI